MGCDVLSLWSRKLPYNLSCELSRLHIQLPLIKGVVLCSFTKSWFCFWGCTITCSVVRKSHSFSHYLHYCNTFLPGLTQTARLVPGLIKATFRKKQCVVIGYLSQCVVIGEQLRQYFSIASPLTRTASSSILPYQFRPREYWTRGSCRTFARTDIARHIKVVMLLLLFWLNHVLDRMSKTA